MKYGMVMEWEKLNLSVITAHTFPESPMSTEAELGSVWGQGFAPRRDPVARSGARFTSLLSGP